MPRIKYTMFQYLYKHRFFFGCVTFILITISSVYLTRWKKQTNTEDHKSITRTISIDLDLQEPNSDMDQVLRYCNAPHTIIRRDEGKLHPNRTLEFVAVITRHGDRAPLQTIRNLSNIDCGTVHTPLLEKFLKTMKESEGRIRHLYPFFLFPLHPDLKRCKESEMSIIGAQQHLTIGNILKQAYIDEHGLMNSSWKPSDIRIYSSPYSRTFQSALAFLYGFLPSFNVSELSISATIDFRFCMSKYYCYCRYGEQLNDINMFGKWQYLENNVKIMKIIDEVSAILQYDPDSPLFPMPFSILDALMVYVCHDAPLPCIPGTDKCATFEHIFELLNHLSSEERYVARTTDRKHVIIKSISLLKHINHNIKNYISKKDPARFILYSAHDLSIIPLLKIFDIYDYGLISYATHIVFEVYSDRSNDLLRYGLRILYKGKDVTKDVIFCKPFFESSKSWTDGFCPLQSFQNFISNLIPSTGYESFDVLCNSQPNMTTLSYT